MGSLQHNKTIVVDGPKVQEGRVRLDQFSWRGFYVQTNNAMVLRGAERGRSRSAPRSTIISATKRDGFGDTRLRELDRPRPERTSTRGSRSLRTRRRTPADERSATTSASNTTSSLFYSLAFLFQTPGVIQEAIKKVTSRRRYLRLRHLRQEGRRHRPAEAGRQRRSRVPVGARQEHSRAVQARSRRGGGGNRMHHKFVVIDFDKPTARVYLGSYNFSIAGRRRRTAKTCCSSATAESRCPTWSRRYAFSTTIISEWCSRGQEGQEEAAARQAAAKGGREALVGRRLTNARKIRDRELFA